MNLRTALDDASPCKPPPRTDDHQVTTELLIRFIVGGVCVCAFSIAGDLFRPKTFSGIFAAAPSVALATLAITATKEPAGYLAQEGHTMMTGAVALGVYCFALALLLGWRPKTSPWVLALGCWAVWLGVAFGLHAAMR